MKIITMVGLRPAIVQLRLLRLEISVINVEQICHSLIRMSGINVDSIITNAAEA